MPHTATQVGARLQVPVAPQVGLLPLSPKPALQVYAAVAPKVVVLPPVTTVQVGAVPRGDGDVSP